MGSSERRLAWARTPARTAAGLLWCLLALLVLLNSPGVFNPDIKPEIYLAPVRSFHAFLSSWQATPELGFPSFNVGVAPVAAVVALLQGAGLDPNASARVLRLLLLTVAALGAARLARELLGSRAGTWPGVVAASVYIANPYVVVAGGTLAVLWPYALLPWLVWALWRAVVSGGGWRWPAAAALVLAAMTGMNAGVVPIIQLVAVPPFLLLARRRAGCSWRHVAGVVVRWGFLSLLLSAYWLVPAVSALGAGQTVVDNSETFRGIAAVSSWSEVVRGLGLWPLYGGDASGPWLAGQVGYLTNALVVLLSFGWVLGLGVALAIARGGVRRAALAAVVLTGVVMVGLNESTWGSPFGHLLALGFDHVPGLAAFRTTNKAGAGLVLAASIAAAAAIGRVLRTRSRGRATAYGLAGAGLVLVGSVGPWWTGGMYVSPMPVPDYWHEAALDIDTGPAEERAWFLPGQVSSDYRWSRERPDDLGNSLFARPTLVRYVIPVTGEQAANLLQAVDQGLQEGTLPPGTLSAVGRRLGVGDVLVRNDVVWEQTGGARPQVVQDVVGADRGLIPVRNYGSPGENTISPTVPPANDFEAALPPVQRYQVAESQHPLHLEAATSTVVLDGDGFAVPPSIAAGLISDGQAYRYAGDLTEQQFADILAAGGRIVLTDTNRRRTTVSGRLTGGLGPLLRADQDPGSTRSLFDASDQTTLWTSGVRVDATAVGSVFGTQPQAAPANAVDGDPSTAWWFGDFHTAVGQALTVTGADPSSWTTVRVHTAAIGSYRIERLAVSAGGRTVETTVDGSGVAVADLGGVSGTTLKVRVVSAAGDAPTLVGISGIDGLPHPVVPVAVTPHTVARLAAGLSPAARSVLTGAPIDVVLTRVRGVGSTATDDEEPNLVRDFATPVGRGYAASGSVEATEDLSERTLDRLAGADGRITVTSSSRAFDLPTLRGSQAADGRLDTAWAPAVPLNAWIRFTAPSRLVSSVDLTQPGPSVGGGWATRIEVLVDGRPVGGGQVGPGRWTVPVTPTRGRTVELRISDIQGSGTVRFLETDAAGTTMSFDPERAAKACVRIATLDGSALLAHPDLPITSTGAVPVSPCPSTTTRLSGGDHHLRPVSGWRMDSLVLRDTLDRGDR